ncbi:MAG: DUF2946 family protein [Bradyrhizobium sp.]
MRRRLGLFVPIVLLSMWVQLLAPVAAFRAFATAVSDPLTMATICSGMASPDDASDTTAPHGANCCGFCSVNHGIAAALDPPPAIHVVLQRQYSLVAWLEAEHPLPLARLGLHAQARAPPSIS